MGLRWHVRILVAVATMLVFGSIGGVCNAEQTANSHTAVSKEAIGAERPPVATWPRRLSSVGRQIVADLTVTPLSYTGPCPAVFTFKGVIYTNRPSPVSYKFVRSDGNHSGARTLVFDKEGRQEVSFTWELADTSTSAPGGVFTGSAVMQVVAPVNMKIQSNEATFRASCTKDHPGEGTTSRRPETKRENVSSAQKPGAGQTAPGLKNEKDLFPERNSGQKSTDAKVLFPDPDPSQKPDMKKPFPDPDPSQKPVDMKKLFPESSSGK
jgi:hypothetical protein